MLSVVCWKWKGAGNSPRKPSTYDRLIPSRYTATHVNRLRSMVARHLHVPHRFVCITDDPTGLDRGIEHYRCRYGDERLYRQTRRLWMFSKEAQEWLGDRALNLDLDTVIMDDITPLVAHSEPLVIWSCRSSSGGYDRVLNPSFVLFDVGALDAMWQAFADDPDGMLRAAHQGWKTSDQAVLNYWIVTREIPVHTLAEADGLYSFRDDILPTGHLPDGASLIGFYDPRYDPSLPDLQARHPWIAEHWR